MKFKLTVLAAGLLIANSALAATAIDLRHQPMNYFATHNALLKNNATQLQEIRTEVDQNQTTHKRIQQTYAGYPVWGATAVIHTPKSNNTKQLTASMNGMVYEDLEKDLANTPNYVFGDEQKAKALAQAKLIYEQKTGLKNIQYQQEETKVMVFVDAKKLAHYAFFVSFYHDDGRSGAHRPTMLLDATSLQLYRQWDQVMTEEMALAGGIGGNTKAGMLTYDNAPGNLSALNMTVYSGEWGGEKVYRCSFVNDAVEVQDVSYASATVATMCHPSETHPNVLWVSENTQGTRWKEDEMNGGYSPSLDAFYDGMIINKFYRDWYGIPALVEADGKTAMKLIMRTHYGRGYDNAFWDGKQMTFGDGGDMFYPLTSLDVGAHEISHGFTQQHSNIDGSYDQMGALHESFSDIAAAAAEYYTTGKNTWQLGSTIMKGDGALRYMDNPKKDGMSLDNMKDYHQGETDPHLLGGVFNKAFYLIATSKGWDTHKAFNIMIKANMYYWTSSMQTFDEAACGVISATKDHGYSVADVKAAFDQVGIDTSKC